MLPSQSYFPFPIDALSLSSLRTEDLQFSKPMSNVTNHSLILMFHSLAYKIQALIHRIHDLLNGVHGMSCT